MDISPSPSGLVQMITEAISSLKSKSGSSQHAIAKFIEEKFIGIPQDFKRMLSTQLNELTKSGRLVKVKRSYKLPVKEKSKKISKEKRVRVNENVAGGEMILGIRKYVDKYERLSQVKILKKSMKEELIQKQKANLEEWKNVAAVSSSVVDLDLGSLEKLMSVQQELDMVKEKTVAGIRNLEDTCKKELWEVKLKQQQQNDLVLAPLYKQRSEIIKSIPKFWLTAFMSDYSFQRRLNKVDMKIIKFLNSMVVEGRPEVTSKCTITLNFDENPYFENPNLTKTISFSYKGIIEVSGTKIDWKSGKGITAGLEEKRSELPHPDVHKSFFTWFSEANTKKLHDPVVNAFASDLWRSAPHYFFMAKGYFCDT